MSNVSNSYSNPSSELFCDRASERIAIFLGVIAIFLGVITTFAFPGQVIWILVRAVESDTCRRLGDEIRPGGRINGRYAGQ
jgi:hypothetical protein